MTILSDSTAFSGFSVNDIAAAKKFYAEILGLQVTEENGLLRLHFRGATDVIIYEKPNHTPATYTILNFMVDDIGQAVHELMAHGIKMEHYDGFNQDELGVARGGPGPHIAWFTDPAGNILSVIQEV